VRLELLFRAASETNGSWGAFIPIGEEKTRRNHDKPGLKTLFLPVAAYLEAGAVKPSVGSLLRSEKLQLSESSEQWEYRC
jgi:hypothetical protein